MFNPVYADQVRLLLRVLPVINEQQCFALKGGTAINLFVQDMPRLSVDIDLAYLPLKDRASALAEIASALDTIGQVVRNTVTGAGVQFFPDASRLVVRAHDAQIKIEPNTVFRGSVFASAPTSLCDTAQHEFEQFVECNMLSIPDLYGSKICAALDRQHPRDLFDVHLMFNTVGLTDDIRTAFVVYLAGHPRPMAELLAPGEQPLDEIFNNQFRGMSREPVSLNTLTGARQKLRRRLHEDLTDNERRFLLSIKQGTPDWQLLPVPHLEQLPAIQWKLRNIERMSPKKHEASVDKLKKVLGL